MASGFDALLEPGRLREFSVGRATVADVLARIVLAAPDGVPQVDIASGAGSGLAELPQGSVSRASSLLLSLGLLARDNPRVERPGRPIIPLRLGSGWAVVGVRIRHRGGRPAELTGVLTPLGGSPEEPAGRGREKQLRVAVSGAEDPEALVKIITTMVKKLTRGEKRRVLGVGVQLGGHVHRGRVIVVPSAPAAAPGGYPLGHQLSKALHGQPTVVDKDANALAVLEIWRKDPDSNAPRLPQRHFAVVAVFEETVRGALVIDRRVYRGGHGLAGEIGHLTVDHSRPHRARPSRPDGAELRDGQGPGDGAGPGDGPALTAKGFDDPCWCAAASARPGGSGYGHVDALATPTRIAGELGIEPAQLPAAAREPGTDERGRPTPAGAVFQAAGQGLGRGIAAMLNVANPGNLLLLLPPELATAAEGSAGARYTLAVETALDQDCFATAAADARAGRARLRVESLDPDDAATGARAAAACVLDSFIAHARGEDTESLTEAARTG